MSQTSKGPIAATGNVVDIQDIRPGQDAAMKSLPATIGAQDLVAPQPVTPVPVTPRPIDTPRGRPAPPLPRRRKRSRLGMWLSMFFFITLPTIAAAVYFLAYASDQYVTTAKFTIRTQSIGKMNIDNIGSGLGTINPAMPAFADSQIVTAYIHSDQLLKDIRQDVDLHAIYSHPSADWWAALDSGVSDEALLGYWKTVSSVHYDLITGITTFTIRAFTPEDAEKVGTAVLSASEALVNELSDRARGDVVKLAQEEAERTRERLDKAIAEIETFQNRERQIDSKSEATATLEIQSKLEGEIAIRQAELSALKEQLSDNAPSVRLMKSRLASMKAELEAMKKREFTTSESGTSRGKLTAIETRLRLEQEIAGKLYAQSLAALEQARQEAQLQSRYLVAFVKPKLPDASLYPQRFYSIGIVFAVSCMVWLFAMLIGAVVREHV
jgi:capsular polysaccharide transport system permease protein